MTPSDYDYLKLVTFAVSAAENAVGHAVAAAQTVNRSSSQADAAYLAGAAAESAINAAKETVRFCSKYAPHARAGRNVLGDFDALDGIRAAGAQLKNIEAVYEAVFAG
jgi:hypothetical protein